MRIELKKFGEILVSRPAGREAYLALFAYGLKDVQGEDSVEVNFAGVKVLTPSWADEVVTPLAKKFPTLRFLHTENASVKATLGTLREFSDLPEQKDE